MSSKAAGFPSRSRYSTTGSLQIRRARGVSPISSDQAAMYHALRTNIDASGSCIVEMTSPWLRPSQAVSLRPAAGQPYSGQSAAGGNDAAQPRGAAQGVSLHGDDPP